MVRGRGWGEGGREGERERTGGEGEGRRLVWFGLVWFGLVRPRARELTSLVLIRLFQPFKILFGTINPQLQETDLIAYVLGEFFVPSR